MKLVESKDEGACQTVVSADRGCKRAISVSAIRNSLARVLRRMTQSIRKAVPQERRKLRIAPGAIQKASHMGLYGWRGERALGSRWPAARQRARGRRRRRPVVTMVAVRHRKEHGEGERHCTRWVAECSKLVTNLLIHCTLVNVSQSSATKA